MTLRSRVTAATAALTIAAGLVVAGGGPSSAASTAPAAGRTVVVSSTAATKYAKDSYLYRADADWVVFSVDDALYAEPANGGAVKKLPNASASTFPGDVELAGDMVFYPGTSRHERYLDLASGRGGTTSHRYPTASPDGVVYVAYDASDGKAHGYDETVPGGRVTDLGALPGFAPKAGAYALADEHGVVFLQSSDGDRHNRVGYVAFDRPGTVVPLQTHDQGALTVQGEPACASLTSNALGCATAGGTIYRVPLDGSAAQTIPITLPKHAKASGAFANVQVTPTRTYWGIDYDEDTHEGYSGPAPAQPIRSVPSATPHAAPTATTFTVATGENNLFAGSDTVYFAWGGTAKDAGIYRLTSDDVHRVALHKVGAQHLLARSLALGTGQAVFEDDSVASSLGVLRTRLFTRSGNTIRLGRIVTLRKSFDDFEPVSTSGSRVLVATGNGDNVTLLSAAGSGNAHAQHTYDDVEPRGLSGTRVIVLGYTHSHHVSHPHMTLVNLVTGSRTDLTTKYGARGTPALFGNYVAFGTKSGAIRRLDLATGTTVLVAAATSSSKNKTPGRVVEWGDYVAWQYPAGDGTVSTHFRNARTMSKAVTLPGDDSIVGASADGVTLRTTTGTPEATVVRPWTSGTTRTVYGGKAYVASSVAVYSTDAGSSSNPGFGTAYAKPLTHAADRPRSLGNPFGDATVRKGHSWHYDLSTSAAPTSCSVAIRRHGHTVRTLSCATTLRRLGEVSVTWNGRTSSGKVAPRGVYTAVVSAANADGALLAADGSHASTTAEVKVR